MIFGVPVSCIIPVRFSYLCILRMHASILHPFSNAEQQHLMYLHYRKGKFRVVVTDMYARSVNVNLTPLTSKRGALATDARGCSLWRYLLERPPPTWESRVRDLLGTRYEFGLCGPGRGCCIYINTT